MKLSNEELLYIWECFFFSPDIEPEFRNVPEGLTDAQWIVLVFQELEVRQLHIPKDWIENRQGVLL